MAKRRELVVGTEAEFWGNPYGHKGGEGKDAYSLGRARTKQESKKTEGGGRKESRTNIGL